MFQTTNQNMMHMFDVYFFQMWTSRLVGAAQRSSVLCPIPWCRCLVILLEDIGQALVAEVEHTWTRDKIDMFFSNSPGTNGNCVGSACSLSTLGSALWRKYYRSAWMWFATQGKKVRKKHQSKRDVRISVCLHLLGWTLAFDDLQISKQLARKLDISSQGTDCD